MKLKHSFLIACLGAMPLCAQQAEQKIEVQKTEKTESASGGGNASNSVTVTVDSNGVTKTETRTSDSQNGRRHPFNPPGQPNQPNNPPPQAQNQKPVPYIGVMTREVSPELRAQFNLPEGFGLMVEEVMPDSPAEHAGLKVHDILVKFEDQQLVSMEQLMLLVRSKHKGDTVNLTVITGGKETQVPVVLGEHVMPSMPQHQQPNFGGGWPHGGRPFMNNGGFGGGDLRNLQNQSREFNEQMERFQREMREYQERIQDWARQGSQGIMPQPPMFNVPGGGGGNQPQRGGVGHMNGGVQMQPLNPAGGNAQQFNFSESHAAANITRRDDSGEYTIKREDGKTTFIARPNNGQEQSWPINTDAERKAVPEEFRDKLRMMDGPNSNIRIQINPGPDNIPQPAPGGTNHLQPAPKNRSTSA